MWTTSCLSPKTGTEDFDLFPPFAKRSREVSRYSEERALPLQLQHVDTFWTTETQPCEEPLGYEPFHAADFSFPSGLIDKRNGVNASLTHENLPHPNQLMGRRKRGQILQTHTANVLQHIGELRMKQRHINELKGDKWLGATAVSQPEESRDQRKFTFSVNEQLLCFPPEINLREMLMENPDGAKKMPYQPASSLTPQFQSTGYEQFADLTPGGNPLMAFATGTAQRSLLMADEIKLNCEGSDGILMSEDDNMLLLQKLQKLF